ncbi:hypothetical protein SDC9_110793 [bioreactor metagenome]|uniref:Uncharacterized protein n=1 Tax=bioreactor metagenome TaxID=1076179 RepID=A0A645BEN9_9ZZZZ
MKFTLYHRRIVCLAVNKRAVAAEHTHYARIFEIGEFKLEFRHDVVSGFNRKIKVIAELVFSCRICKSIGAVCFLYKGSGEPREVVVKVLSERLPDFFHNDPCLSFLQCFDGYFAELRYPAVTTHKTLPVKYNLQINIQSASIAVLQLCPQ